MQNQTEPMDASQQFCPNQTCSARGKIGEGNIRIHSIVEQGQLDVVHVQADEIRVKMRRMKETKDNSFHLFYRYLNLLLSYVILRFRSS